MDNETAQKWFSRGYDDRRGVGWHGWGENQWFRFSWSYSALLDFSTNLWIGFVYIWIMLNETHSVIWICHLSLIPFSFCPVELFKQFLDYIWLNLIKSFIIYNIPILFWPVELLNQSLDYIWSYLNDLELQDADRDGSGSMDFQEFVEMMIKVMMVMMMMMMIMTMMMMMMIMMMIPNQAMITMAPYIWP